MPDQTFAPTPVEFTDTDGKEKRLREVKPFQWIIEQRIGSRRINRFRKRDAKAVAINILASEKEDHGTCSRLLGIIENMSYFSCPHCNEHTDIFGTGGGKVLAGNAQVPFLGEIALDPAIRTSGDEGHPIVAAAPDSDQAQAFLESAGTLKRELGQHRARCYHLSPASGLWRPPRGLWTPEEEAA